MAIIATPEDAGHGMGCCGAGPEHCACAGADGGVDHRAVRDVHQAEHADLGSDGPGGAAIGELREQGEEEKEDLGVEAADPDALRGLAQP